MISKVALILFLSWLNPDTTPNTWSVNKKLAWDDFLAKAPKTNPHSALSRVEIRYESSVDKSGNMSMKVEAVFIPELSWVKADDKTQQILNHEQYHFHITEWWARQLRKEIVSRTWNRKTFEKEFGNVFKKLMDQLLKEQLKYDNETDHSKNLAKQTEWQKKIDQGLADLAAHSKTTIPLLFE